MTDGYIRFIWVGYMFQMAGCKISDPAKVMCFGKVIFNSSWVVKIV